MVGEVYDNTASEGYGNSFFSDLNTRIRDIEERQMLLRDKMIIVSNTFVKDRDRNFEEIQKMKGVTEQLKDENKRLKEMFLRISEVLNNTARKEELNILQKQFDLFRKN